MRLQKADFPHFFAIFICILASGCNSGGNSASEDPSQNRVLSKEIQMSGNTARPGWMAIKEEFDAAVNAGTVEALELFIARHPDSEWTSEARKKLAKLRGN